MLKKRIADILGWIALSCVILCVAVLGLYAYQQNTVPMEPVPPEPSVTISDPPSPTPSPTSSSAKPTPSPKPSTACLPNPKGDPNKIVVRRGKEVFISSKLVRGGMDKDRVWSGLPHVSDWFAEPGWPTPGTCNSTVPAMLGGHVRWHGIPDVFARLGETLPGDRVYIYYPKGVVVAFEIIQKPELVNKDDLFTVDKYIKKYSSVKKRSQMLTLLTCDKTSTVLASGHLKGNTVTRAVRIQ